LSKLLLTLLLRARLATLINALHAAHIHHHDIELQNIVVDQNGIVTWVDLNSAEEVLGQCKFCSDKAALNMLEGDSEGFLI
jgi:serine/threonine protein kinase